MFKSKKKKKKKEIEIGSVIREMVASKGKKRRVGEVLMILMDQPDDPTLECVEVDPDELTSRTKGADGLKMFRVKKSRAKHYTPRKTLFKKKTYEKGTIVRIKRGTSIKYGQVVCFVHPDGLYSTSHEQGYNGKDFLECVEISPKPGLAQQMQADGEPKRFTANPKQCKIMEVITTNSQGEDCTVRRLKIDEEEE
ncbi:MAG: hypothetical protein CMI31_11125 [Opitutae bacterium]|nr:hypothetical protein [Opitutae bacterium]MBG30535.1 hypothetical protein [Opitutae bacterium]|tara:strand:- start:293 stop:877 length:585 start_codon:yes stop_codon:yes gene_type:complete